MKRTGFASTWQKPARKALVLPDVPPPVRAGLRMDDGNARAMVSVPKPEKARPGKRAPTVAEAAYMASIAALGCIVCRLAGRLDVPAEVHHLLRGGQRIGHGWTIPLCSPHHRDDSTRPDCIARHPWRIRFEAAYGTEESLLHATRVLVFGEVSK